VHLQLERRPGAPDVSADTLSLSFLAAAGLEVVATREVPLAAGLVAVVEVLAASHRVHVRGAAGVLATEQVACVDGAPARLPATATHVAGGLHLSFTSERPSMDGGGLAALAEQLRRSAGPRTLVVSFPGHADALTSVRVGDDGWETWHLYPGPDPRAVRTRTDVVQP